VAIGGMAFGLLGALVAWLAWLRLRRVQTQLRDAYSTRPEMDDADRVAFVVNPTKNGITEFKALAETMCREQGLGRPVWLETTIDSPGTVQAAGAVAAHPRLRAVIAAGGDGTVRAVAAGLAGGKVPLGIVPLGTANLLARNLRLPVLSIKDALGVALTGVRRSIDLGRISTWGPSGTPILSNEAFLVIAGLGFDAELVSTADTSLKSRLGWPAYFLSGINHLADKPIRVRVTMDGEETSLSVRSVMFGNCGLLPAGLQLVPDADLADGTLDLAMAYTRHGLVGWASLAGQVILNGIGLRWMPKFASGRLWYHQSPRFLVRCESPQKVQLDGELVESAQVIEAWVDHLSLVVRVQN
jgi:diacylglycerol kinase family enzyme